MSLDKQQDQFLVDNSVMKSVKKKIIFSKDLFQENNGLWKCRLLFYIAQ